MDQLEFNIEELAESALRQAVPLAKLKAIELMLLISKDLPRRLAGPAASIAQALDSLLKQAIEAGAAGDMALVINGRMGNGVEGIVLQAAVSACATMAPQAFRCDLVESLGGASGVEAWPGHGFVLWWRLGVEGRGNGAQGESGPSFYGKRALVVDASAGHREVMRQKLQDMGIEADGAGDGADAAQKAAAARYDVTFVDMSSAGQFQTSEIGGAVVFMVYLLEPAQEQAGQFAYLNKPIRRRELSECLLKVLSPLGQAQQPNAALEYGRLPAASEPLAPPAPPPVELISAYPQPAVETVTALFPEAVTLPEAPSLLMSASPEVAEMPAPPEAIAMPAPPEAIAMPVPPEAIAMPAPAEAVASAMPASDEVTVRLGRRLQRSVLLCDDDTVVTEILGELLKERGWTVFLAENGQEGLRHIRASNPSIVILDIDMPIKTGIDVLRDLQQSPPPALPYVIVLSNHESEKMRSLCLSLGARETMIKPFRLSDLIQRIEEILSQGGKGD